MENFNSCHHMVSKSAKSVLEILSGNNTHASHEVVPTEHDQK